MREGRASLLITGAIIPVGSSLGQKLGILQKIEEFPNFSYPVAIKR